jgi:hypothetical protein
MLKYTALASLALSLATGSAVAGGALTYELLPDSTITPSIGAFPVGLKEALTGTFTWMPESPSQVFDSNGFFTTSLDLSSGMFSMTLAPNARDWSSSTAIGPGGFTGFMADVDLLNSNQNPWTIATNANGSYVGPAYAPTELVFGGVGLAPGDGGFFIAQLHIDAELVPAHVPDSGGSLGLVGAALFSLVVLYRTMGPAWARHE